MATPTPAVAKLAVPVAPIVTTSAPTKPPVKVAVPDKVAVKDASYTFVFAVKPVIVKGLGLTVLATVARFSGVFNAPALVKTISPLYVGPPETVASAFRRRYTVTRGTVFTDKGAVTVGPKPDPEVKDTS